MFFNSPHNIVMKQKFLVANKPSRVEKFVFLELDSTLKVNCLPSGKSKQHTPIIFFSAFMMPGTLLTNIYKREIIYKAHKDP